MTTMRDGDWFDVFYFGHKQPPGGDHKSNYSRISGGYTPEIGAPEQFAGWVVDNLKAKRQMNKSLVPTVLELGCASGESIGAMRNLGVNAFGIDASEYILGLTKPENEPFLCEFDMRDLDVEGALTLLPGDWELPDQLSAIVSKDVMEHATEHAIDGLLLAFSRLARWQFHVVNTGEHEYQAAGGDQSHFLVKPLAWWEKKAEDLGIQAVFKET